MCIKKKQPNSELNIRKVFNVRPFELHQSSALSLFSLALLHIRCFESLRPSMRASIRIYYRRYWVVCRCWAFFLSESVPQSAIIALPRTFLAGSPEIEESKVHPFQTHVYTFDRSLYVTGAWGKSNQNRWRKIQIVIEANRSLVKLCVTIYELGEQNVSGLNGFRIDFL